MTPGTEDQPGQPPSERHHAGNAEPTETGQLDDSVASASVEASAASASAADDAELIAVARDGAAEAYAALRQRHVEAAQRLARTLREAPAADDLVDAAFAALLTELRSGDGPDLAFRTALHSAVRRAAEQDAGPPRP
ncbi:MAG: hypothetical protein ACRDT8_24245, partial [Micromonosporaceae bacterium]